MYLYINLCNAFNFCLLCSGFIPVSVLMITVDNAWGPYVIIEVDPGSATCKARATHAVLSTQPLLYILKSLPFSCSIPQLYIQA